MRPKNDALNIFMAFFKIAFQKTLSVVSFIERPVRRSL